MSGHVGRAAYLLGLAGLLPPIAAVGLLALVDPGAFHPLLRGDLHLLVGMAALLYAGVILSFLGGMWWGFAMRRQDGQGRLAAVAVVPSLIAWPLMLAGPVGFVPMAWSLVLMGVAVLLTLVVDRHLVATGEAPERWMRLRVPLSVGLGGLTILAGVIAG